MKLAQAGVSAQANLCELKLRRINFYSLGYGKFALKLNVKLAWKYGDHTSCFLETHSPVAGINLCFSIAFPSLSEDLNAIDDKRF